MAIPVFHNSGKGICEEVALEVETAQPDLLVRLTLLDSVVSPLVDCHTGREIIGIRVIAGSVLHCSGISGVVAVLIEAVG